GLSFGDRLGGGCCSDRVLEAAVRRVRGRQGVEMVRLGLELDKLLGHRERGRDVAYRGVARGRQQPGKVVRDRRRVWLQLDRRAVVRQGGQLVAAGERQLGEAQVHTI